MSGTADSIRQGRGMLPKNLHWYLAAILAVASAAVIYSSHRQERARSAAQGETRKTATEADIRKKYPDPARLINESASQAKDVNLSSSQPQARSNAKADAAGLAAVPGIQTDPRAVIERQRDSASAYGGAAVADGDDARHTRATIATSPILALSDASETAKPAAPARPSPDPFLPELSRANRPPSIAADERKLLEQAVGANQTPNSVPGEEYLENAKRNERWLQQTAAAAAPRKTLSRDTPISPYTITQGAVIPAVVVSPINSDLPGQILARTTQNVYDSVCGRYLLIPAGSLAYGGYNNAVIDGQSRLAVVFNRIVFPDGSGVTLGNMQAADAAGQAGVPGDVDNHFWKMFGSSMLIAGIASIFQPGQRGTTNNYYVSGSPGQGMSAVGQVLVDVSRSVLARNTRIPPTVTVRQGERFNIIVQQDLGLSPYAGEDINAH